MNWPVFWTVMSAAALVAVLSVAVRWAVPNYDDPDEMHPALIALVFGFFIALIVGLVFGP